MLANPRSRNCASLYMIPNFWPLPNGTKALCAEEIVMKSSHDRLKHLPSLSSTCVNSSFSNSKRVEKTTLLRIYIRASFQLITLRMNVVNFEAHFAKMNGYGYSNESFYTTCECCLNFFFFTKVRFLIINANSLIVFYCRCFAYEV